jgi:CDP-Glycerol:Poly(glycerophosphate) glycerophosphotransferase
MVFFEEYKNVNELLKQKQQVVFYSESRHYAVYFRQLINDLLATDQVQIIYITSDKQDPMLQKQSGNLKVVYVKWMLGYLFSRLKADVMIMTMPDLGNFLFKRSAAVSCYIYIFHAAVSTHQQYRQQAFDNYDAVFCTGAYQASEIRKTEEIYQLKKKDLIAYGYPLFDELQLKKNNLPEKTILVAPSWYGQGIFETCFEELMKVLSSLSYPVIIRSHPEYEKRNKKKFTAIKKMISRTGTMQIDNSPTVTDRLSSAGILITDRSGIAFEFAFGTGRPVLFIDTPLKINNPAYEQLNLEPLENSHRSQLGLQVSPSSLLDVPEKINELLASTEQYSRNFAFLKKELFYNSTAAYSAGVEYVLAKINQT